MEHSDIEKYLSRIHFEGDLNPDLHTLQKILKLHPKYIPFENIDTYLGKVPSLEFADIFYKLVELQRGGYCYEQNLLLKAVLEYIGFNVNLYLARVVWRKEVDSKPAKTHALLIVHLNNEDYLVDVGFGSVTLTASLLLNNQESQKTPNGVFQIIKKEEEYALQFFKKDWLPVYKFKLEEVEFADLEIPNWYLATHPNSGFKNNLMITKVDENARYTISNDVFSIRYNGGKKEEQNIENSDYLLIILKNVFNLISINDFDGNKIFRKISD